MGTVQYEFRLYDEAGNDLNVITNVHKMPALVRAENNVGALELWITGWSDFQLFAPERRIGVFRSVANGNFFLVGDTYWVILDRSKLRQNKKKFVRLVCVDMNVLLARRIIPYPAGNAGATKNKAADNMAKEIVRENYQSGTARNISSILSVASDTSQAPIISKAFNYEGVLPTLQEICLASYQSGTYLSFDIVASNANSFTFYTYVGQRGLDRRATTNNALIIDSELNLGDFEIADKNSEVVSVVYAKGQGEQVVTVSDTSRELSAIARVEKLVSAGNANTTAQILAEALAALRNYRPKNSFSGEFIQSDGIVFGRDIDFGDYVTIQVELDTFDVRLSAFKLSLSSDGEEALQVIFRSDG